MKEALFTFIKTIKATIQPFDYDIERTTCEKSGRSCYVFYNKKASCKESIKPEIRQFFTAIVDQLIEKNGRLRNIAVSNIGNSFEEYALSAGECDDISKDLIKSGWLLDDDNAGVVLSPRSLLEFKDDLKERSVPDCNGCKVICVLGENCQECGIKMHFRCARRLVGESGNCPNCSTKWIFQ